MNLISLKKRELLYDGTQIEFYQIHKIELEDLTSIKFNVSELNKISELKKDWSEPDFDKLITHFNGSIFNSELIPELVYFKNQNGLTVYFKETEKYLAILSLGEVQPSRYQIYLEALFMKIISF